MLEIRNATKYFGGLKALDNVSFSVDVGELVGVIGPNGAGKTTLFNMISRTDRLTSGQIIYRTVDLTRITADQVASLGITRTFQNIRLFSRLTVLENVLIGLHCRTISGPLQAILRTPKFLQEEREARETAYRYLDMLGIAHRAADAAGELPYGDQRRLEIVRALVSEPQLLLLDEPSAGMNTGEALELRERIRYICKELHKTILLIEHNMKVVMDVADRVVVLNQGAKIAEGPPREIQRDPVVIEAYLGRRYLSNVGS